MSYLLSAIFNLRRPSAPLHSHPLNDARDGDVEDRPANQKEEEGGGGDGEGRQDEIERTADESGTSGFDQVGDGIDLVDGAQQPSGGDGVHDRSGIHGELAENANGAADICVEQADGGEEAADRGAENDECDVSKGEENDGPGREHADVEEDGDEQDKADGGDEGGFADAGEDRGNARKVELHEHGLGRVERVDRLGKTVEKGLPEEGADHDKGGIGHAGIGDLNDTRSAQEKPDEGGGDGWKEEPGIAKNALAELRLHVSAEEREGKLARIPEFRKHLANQPPGIGEAGVRRVNR